MTDDTVAYMGWGISAQEQIDGFRREVRELRDENAKLRAMQDTWQENDARLRELVRELYEDQCDDCDRWRYRDRLSELGMGVDDG